MVSRKTGPRVEHGEYEMKRSCGTLKNITKKR